MSFFNSYKLHDRNKIAIVLNCVLHRKEVSSINIDKVLKELFDCIDYSLFVCPKKGFIEQHCYYLSCYEMRWGLLKSYSDNFIAHKKEKVIQSIL